MENELLSIAKSYGLGGILLLAIALYIWKVHLPAQERREKEQGAERKEHLAVVKGIADEAKADSKKATAEFMAYLEKQETAHTKQVETITSHHREAFGDLAVAIREIKDKREAA